MSLETDLEGMTSSVRSLVTEIQSLESVLKSTNLRNPAGSGGSGQFNLGTSGRNVMENSLAPVNSQPNATNSLGSGGDIGGNGLVSKLLNNWIKTAGGVASGLSMMMPSVDDTTTMAKNYFSASLMSGTNGQQLGNYMTNAMSGAMTDPLGASRVAGNLSGMGFAMYGGMAANFTNAVTATANLSKYMGIDNDTASQAIGGFSSRSLSQTLMQNYGMFTTDPNTGEPLTVQQKVSQLGDMYLSTYNGEGPQTKEGVLRNLQSGWLGANLESSGLDPTQQSLVARYMVAKVSGEQFNLDTAGGISAVADAAGANPFSAEMSIYSSQAGSMNAATQAYIQGNNDAAAAVKLFQGAITSFLQSPAGQFMARPYAAVNTASTDNVVQGGTKAITSLISGYFSQMSILADTAVEVLSGGMVGGGGAGMTSVYAGGYSGGAGGTGGAVASVSEGRSTEAPTKGFSLIRPVKGRVSAKYGSTSKTHPTPHNAIDFAVASGTPVKAAAAGKVVAAGGTGKNTWGTSNHSYGLYVILSHQDGYSTLYAHLSSISVSTGQEVQQGQPIGLSGNTGYSTGPHLHFELRKGGKKIDPGPFMGGGAGTYTAGTGQNDTKAGGAYSGGMGLSGGPSLFDGYNMTGSAGSVAIPPSYSGASIGSAAAGATSSTRAIGHGASQGGGSGASIGHGIGGGDVGAVRSSGGNNVVINLSIANASPGEAEKFAVMVKDILENDKLATSMGRM